ncbi:hypothetical protein V6N13_029043 [Hibiscus sabdariffa]|uniref:Uncharacterized protein n=1 Tax=Hibiscus sabdariffa TaxID=183260 RepID=A0ABR2TBW1_9ROSI
MEISFWFPLSTAHSELMIQHPVEYFGKMPFRSDYSGLLPVNMFCGAHLFLQLMPCSLLEAVGLVTNKVLKPIHCNISGFMLLHVA